MKKSKMLFLFSIFLCLTLTSGNALCVIHAENGNKNARTAVMSEALISSLNAIRDDEFVNVVMWQKDIDHESIEKQVEEAISVKRSDIEESYEIETVQKYISKKRDYSMKEYEVLNNDLVTNVVSNIDKSEIVFVSRFSPVVIAAMPKTSVYSASKSSSIVYMDVFVNSEIIPFSDVAMVNNGTSYLRDTNSINATGNGVKIGQIEPGILTPNLSCGGTYYFDSDKLHQISTDSYSSHANLVAAIMVGQSVTYEGKTYKGIAPDAELFYAGCDTELECIRNIEDMISSENGVNVINMSAGSPQKFDAYDFFSRWIDHIAFVHDVHFVKSAGNSSISPKYISSPGMAFNAIIVGNVGDNNTIIGANAPSSLSGQELDSNFGVHYSSCFETEMSYSGHKPDVALWGTSIQYGDIFINGFDESNNTGTSFAAPQVTGIIAQLCEKKPSLLTNNSKMKALLTTTAVYRAHFYLDEDDEENDYTEEYEYNDVEFSDTCVTLRQGAGIVNAVCAYNTVNSGKTKDVTMADGTQYYTFTINVPSSYEYLRLGMSWIKKNSVTGDHSSTSSNVNNRLLADLRLEIFYGTNTTKTPIAWSDTSGNNLELLQFEVEKGGTYTVRITNHSYNDGLGSQYISLAWY